MTAGLFPSAVLDWDSWWDRPASEPVIGSSRDEGFGMDPLRSANQEGLRVVLLCSHQSWGDTFVGS